MGSIFNGGILTESLPTFNKLLEQNPNCYYNMETSKELSCSVLETTSSKRKALELTGTPVMERNNKKRKVVTFSSSIPQDKETPLTDLKLCKTRYQAVLLDLFYIRAGIKPISKINPSEADDVRKIMFDYQQEWFVKVRSLKNDKIRSQDFTSQTCEQILREMQKKHPSAVIPAEEKKLYEKIGLDKYDFANQLKKLASKLKSGKIENSETKLPLA